GCNSWSEWMLLCACKGSLRAPLLDSPGALPAVTGEGWTVRSIDFAPDGPAPGTLRKNVAS
ncbi:MAG TPA: hypothetical protein PLX50_00500, partial [Candidatus Aminicenantes bacterium]|nr:hypothetical protein [Candidatus Aminicenantes bacterium]